MRRASLALATIVVICLAAPALAQTARASGTVKDTSGKAMKGATVKASNKDAYPPQITSSTDDKGRWAMIGLRTGTWTFVVEAPGYAKQEAQWPVRVAGTVPMHFVLARELGPIPGALAKNIQQQLAAANALRDKGQLDQALAAYEQIRDQNPKLTAVNLVVGGVYRKKAALENDPNARRALFDRAIATYTSMLTDEAASERAQAEIESTRTEAAATR
jgi:tetratricopeptide (TPR) repeat protein